MYVVNRPNVSSQLTARILYDDAAADQCTLESRIRLKATVKRQKIAQPLTDTHGDFTAQMHTD